MNAGIQIAIDNLLVAIQQATARLAELDLYSIESPDNYARMTYTDGGRQIGWNEYRAALVAQIDKFKGQLEELYKADQIISGPFEVVAPAGGYGPGPWAGWI